MLDAFGGHFLQYFVGVRLQPGVAQAALQAALEGHGVLLRREVEFSSYQARSGEALGAVAVLVLVGERVAAAAEAAVVGGVAFFYMALRNAVVAEHDVVVVLLFHFGPAPGGNGGNEARLGAKLADEVDTRHYPPVLYNVHHLLLHRARAGRGVLREQRQHDDALHGGFAQLIQRLLDAGFLVAHSEGHHVFGTQYFLHFLLQIEAVVEQRRAALRPQLLVNLG